LLGRLADEAVAQGRHPGLADIAIAALAQHGGHTLLTRNLRHFEPLGVACVDPIAQFKSPWASPSSPSGPRPSG
jgi:predicted nucleic acid-binding protein